MPEGALGERPARIPIPIRERGQTRERRKGLDLSGVEGDRALSRGAERRSSEYTPGIFTAIRGSRMQKLGIQPLNN